MLGREGVEVLPGKVPGKVVQKVCLGNCPGDTLCPKRDLNLGQSGWLSLKIAKLLH